MDASSLQHCIQEIYLIQSSLLPNEIILFLDSSDTWLRILDSYSLEPSIELQSVPRSDTLAPPRLKVGIDGWDDIWFEIDYVNGQSAVIDAKGEALARNMQSEWQELIQRKLKEAKEFGAEFAAYDLLTELLPLLHAERDAVSEALHESQASVTSFQHTAAVPYHALFTSHHLLSTSKRRSLQHWSSSLSLQGFAKVGYPGIIYASGDKDAVDEFVGNVKAMTWLALRLRFNEHLLKNDADKIPHKGTWKEFEKVGEVVAEMKVLGREESVTSLGIGVQN